ncbi:MAG: RHS repeat protein, partial [Burkholderiales bacterium]|nr:RHS repeat protein [Burkholderiales bacterium]
MKKSSTKHMKYSALKLTMASTFALTLTLAVMMQPSHAQSTVYQYTYDANGNVTKITNGNNAATKQSYDALGRLQSQMDADNKITKYGYDGLDRLIKVTDARTFDTLYTVDGLGNQLSLNSPDTGVTTT